MVAVFIIRDGVLEDCPRPRGQKCAALALASKPTGLGLGLEPPGLGLED